MAGAKMDFCDVMAVVLRDYGGEVGHGGSSEVVLQIQEAVSAATDSAVRARLGEQRQAKPGRAIGECLVGNNG